MIDLAAFFDAAVEAASTPKTETAPEAVPGNSRFPNPDREEQVIDSNSISRVSRVSHDKKEGRAFFDFNDAQAREPARAGGRARGAYVGGRETREQRETPAGSEPYISHSLSKKRETKEKTGNNGAFPPPSPSLSADEAAAFDERAGFLQHDCGLSRAEAERQVLAELRPQRVKPSLPEQDGLALWRAGLGLLSPERELCAGYRGEEWPRTFARARSFLDNFGAQAEALGWTAPRLFGVHPEAGIGRVDHCGALVLPVAGPVRAITATEIAFGHLTHRQKPGQPEGIPIWEFGR